MPQWLNFHNIHTAIRVSTAAYLVALVGWTAYRYYNDRRDRGRQSDRLFKRFDGDVIEDEEEDDRPNQSDDATIQCCKSRPDPSDINKNCCQDQQQGGSNLETHEGSESDSDNTADEEDAEEDEEEDEEEYDDAEDEEKENNSPQNVQDIEDIGPPKDKSHGIKSEPRVKMKDSKRFKPSSEMGNSVIDYGKFTEEQITEKLREDLSKQGYRLIETHAAVKICRWTKNSMRGRGGCYKHTFYGIKSYQCMEMTPNLACASKCTFCWRHHKNPVGTEWKWKLDEPDVIVEQGVKNHLEMVNQLKGVPGVTKERFEEAKTVRHCALSLVGEPIFYPKINELLTLLHSRKISTFLVTNAQFPDAMRKLIPITQLYVSIDAPNKSALKKIDRPLYKDFWERYIECLKIIREKKQRTVYRLTLVQGFNMQDLEGYANLIKIGEPDFIEIKGVTYCGTSKANKLTMKNVPWHEQVVEFGQQLLDFIDKSTYELACEHSHSNCVLIAHKKFKVDGRWHTWINYEKYFELIEASAKQPSDQNSTEEFTSLDYMAESPSWAVFGSEEGGFDPEHRRWIRKDHKLKLLKERVESQRKLKQSNGNKQ